MLRIAVAMAMLFVARFAAADTLLVISSDPEFASAVGTAVALDEMSVQPADLPTPSLETIARDSREVAQREHAAAVTWLLVGEQGATLIVYDRRADRVLVRSLPYTGRLDATQAAEAARVTRTMLRALRVAEEPAPPPPPPSPPSIVAPPAPPPTPTILAIDLDGGVRVRGPGATASPAGTVGVIWRSDALGFALAARYAPPAELDGMFVGQISDHSVAALARYPMRVGRRTDAIATAGLAIHRIVLEGTLGGMPREEARFDPAARVGLTTSFALDPTIGVGITVSADWLLRRQSYEAGHAEVLVVPRIQLGVGVTLLARIL